MTSDCEDSEFASVPCCPNCGSETPDSDYYGRRRCFFCDYIGGGEAAKRFRLELYDDQELVNKLKAIFPKKSLYICGGVGVGKTHLAIGLARKSYPYIKIANILDLLREMRGAEISAQKSYIDNVAKRAVYVLDDVGVEKKTEFSEELLYDIINTRYTHNQSGFIVTSNLKMSEIAQRYNPRIVSRLYEMCENIDLFNKKDYRVYGKNQKTIS